MSVIILFSFLIIISQLFNEPLFTKRKTHKVPKNFICNNFIISYVGKIFFYTFSRKDNAFISLFFTQFLTFFNRVFTEFIPKSTSGVNFFSNFSSLKRSFISPYELQVCAHFFNFYSFYSSFLGFYSKQSLVFEPFVIKF